ncbi:T9SS type A sorting domain-containing protein [Winogradskyella sp.]|uniref:T9SS type A sorting domain-containing protein n=1 Tax=Winogradskyella sp. TaxID=1883156 RepID=UPI003AB159DF
MKKITLLLALFFASNLMFAQEVLSEDFEAGLTVPTGWTIEDLTTSGEIWTIETGGEAGGFTAPNTLLYESGLDGNYATMDSDGYGSEGGAENTTLTSPVFDASSITSATLTFDTVYNGNFGGLGEIEVYNGSAWVNVQTYATAIGSTPNTTITGSQLFDISEIAGVTNAQIRFVWTGNWSISWSIDNISVFQCTETAAPAVATTPLPADAATAIGITADGGLNFSWNDAGNAGDNYTLNIGTTNPPSQAIEGIENGVLITGLGLSTTYFWSIDITNCFGTTTSSVWSFTTDDQFLSIGEEVSLETLNVYPNPTSDVLNIKSSQDVDNVTVFNLLGQNVANFTKNEINNSSIDLSELSKGLYLVKISSGTKTKTLRVTKE